MTFRDTRSDNRCADRAEVDAGTASALRELLDASPDALRLTKRTLDAALEASSYDAAMEIEERAQSLMIRGRMR